MGQYLVLIYEEETGWEEANPEKTGEMMAEHQRFGERHQASIRGGNALQPTATATSMRQDASGGRRDRRAVRRDQGGARRLLPHRGGRPRRGARHGQAGPAPVRRGRGPPDPGLRLSDARSGAMRRSKPRSPTRTVVSGPSCSPRRCGSTARHRPRRGVRAGRLRPGARPRGAPTASRTEPGAWLTTVARTARHRPAPAGRHAAPARCRCSSSDAATPAIGSTGSREIADDRLRLIFTCCHPALCDRAAGGADAAPGLRAHHGRGGPGVPRQRDDDGGPHHPGQEEDRPGPHPLPGAAGLDELPERIDAVLPVVHLVFTTGHTAPAGRRSRPPRPGRAGARPGPHAPRAAARRIADVAGLLALILLTDARRRDPAGRRRQPGAARRPGPLPWDRRRHRRGRRTGARGAPRRRPPGRFALMAAIAAVHAEAPTWEATDWAEIVSALRPPGADLAVAGGRAQPGRGRRLRRRAREPASRRSSRWPTSPSWPTYPYLAAARADLLRVAGATAPAPACSTRRPWCSPSNEVEREFLARRIAELGA